MEQPEFALVRRFYFVFLHWAGVQVAEQSREPLTIYKYGYIPVLNHRGKYCRAWGPDPTDGTNICPKSGEESVCQDSACSFRKCPDIHGQFNVWTRQRFERRDPRTKTNRMVWGGITGCDGEEVLSEMMSNLEKQAMIRLPVPCTDPSTDFPGYTCDRASCSRNQYLQCIVKRAQDFYDEGDYESSRRAYQYVVYGNHKPALCAAPCFDTATQTLAENGAELAGSRLRRLRDLAPGEKNNFAAEMAATPSNWDIAAAFLDASR